MSDVKNYIVQYDIRANTEQAATQLRAIMESIAGVEGPMKTLQQTLGTLNSTLTQLKSNQNLAFTPTIDTTSFDRKLKAMQVSVKTAADEMAAAINRALQGNTAVGKAAKNSLGNVLGPRTAKDIQKDIAAYKEKINQIMGAPDKKTGKRHFAFADLNDEHKAQVKALRQQISNDSKLLKEAEKLERQNAAIQTKSEKTAQKAASKPSVATKAQAARLTNVTPAIIREWGKVFGNTKAKSLTVSIYGKADGPNGAITVINQVKTMLGELGALGKFDIMPKPNAAAFAEIESKLSSLAALSKSVMAPFTGDTTKKQGKSNTLVGLTKDEQKKLEQARASATDYKKKIDDVQRKLYANQQKYDQQPTPALKGQITRGTKLLQQYKLGLSTAQYDIQQLQEKATPAVQPTTKIAPLTINVVGNLTGVNNVGKEFPVNVIGQIQKLQPPANAEIPVAVKITASQVNQSLKAIPRPELPVSIKLMWNKGAIGKQEQLKAIKDKVPPITLQLDTTKAIESLEAFIAKVKGSSPQTIVLTANGTSSSTSAKSTATAIAATTTTGSKTSSTKSNTPPSARERYDAMKSKAATKVLTDKQKVDKWRGYNAQLNNYHAERQRMYESLFGTASAHSVRQKMYDELFKAVPKQPEWKSAAERVKRLDDAVATFQRGLTPYEQAESNKRAKSIRDKNTTDHTRRANALRTQVHNAMIPFASNQSQLNTLIKYRKFFGKAIQTTGITPTQGMQTAQMLKYLQGVSQQMQQANVQVPMQLQGQINKLQAQVAKATQAAAQADQAASNASKKPIPSKQRAQTVRLAQDPRSFYTNARKWAYPFTGVTSFGARTPMAVDMAKGMGVMFAVGGAMSAIGNSFSQAIEYQNTMRTTNAILKNGTKTYSPSGFEDMERVVRTVGIKTKFSAPEVASAARFLAMAGYDINAINHSIQAIADLALIGDTDLGETADKMTNIMTTFGIKPEKMREAANIMTTTATRSNTDLMMLAESAKYGGGVANMYGYNDPNLFADTMALFGIMGNAGIQASSAGTALRMMYQNIFKPNKNQKAVLEMLKNIHGISTTYKTADGKDMFRSISDVLIDIANKVPQDEMATIVGNLFRITAQPGAAATLRAAAQEDGTDESQVAGGIDAVSKFVGEKGLSSLVDLMLANRASVSSNISKNIALEKQNTVKGLWAQVTSTFTEGILLAFENNTGKFEKMLGGLRDYLAKPETIQMIQRLFDLIVKIGKIMGQFVEYWVALYNKFPGIIEQWIKWQMIFTQIGSLMAPIVSVIGVLDRLKSVLFGIAGISPAASAVGASARASAFGGATGIAASGLVSSVFGLAGNKEISKTWRTQKHNNARKVKLLEENIMKQMLLYGFIDNAAKNTWNRAMMGDRHKSLGRALEMKRDHEDRQRAIVARAKRIYGTQARSRRAFMSALTYNPIVGVSSLFASIKSLLSGLAVSLAKVFGALLNPASLAIAGIGSLGYSIYRLYQHANSATKTQIEARKGLTDELKQSLDTEKERRQNTEKFLSQNGFMTARMNSFTQDAEDDKNGENKQNKWYDSYKYIFNKDILTNEGASRKANEDIVNALRRRYVNDKTMRLALSKEEYTELLGAGLDFTSRQVQNDVMQMSQLMALNASGSSTEAAVNTLSRGPLDGDKNTAIQLLDKASLLSVINEGANDSKILYARQRIIDLYKKLGKTDEFTKQAMNIVNSTVNPNDYTLLGDEFINAENLSNANFDWSRLHAYQNAGYRVLMAEVEASTGSIIDQYIAIEELKKGLIPYSNEWNKAISRVIGNQRLIQDVLFNGKQFDNIEILLNTLPDGRLDFSNILTQIQEKIKGFAGDTELFFQMADQVYDMLVKLGVIKDTGIEGRTKWIEEQTKNVELSDQAISKYNLDQGGVDIGGLSVSPADIAFMERPSNVDSDNNWWSMQQKAVDDMRHNMANKIASKHYDSTETANNGKIDPYNPKSNVDKANPGTNTTTDQNDYSSKYTASAARPTQIVLNIDKMANFDRTTIAANAEERDMMLALEQKMAETVYRIVAEAMNSASSMMRT